MTPAKNVASAVVFPETIAASIKLDLRDHESRVRVVRELLQIGLAAYGELERLDAHFDLLKASKISLPRDLRVIHPTGSTGTICDFAEAMRLFESMALEMAQFIGDNGNLSASAQPASVAKAQSNVAALVPAERFTPTQKLGHMACVASSTVESLVRSARQMIISTDIDQTNKQIDDACCILEMAEIAAKKLSGDCLNATEPARSAA